MFTNEEVLVINGDNEWTHRIINAKENNVCDHCGGKLSYGKDADTHRIHTICKNCCSYTNGVSPKIYEIALNYVDKHHFNYYHIYTSEELNHDADVSKMCSIIYFILHTFGVDENNNSKPVIDNMQKQIDRYHKWYQEEKDKNKKLESIIKQCRDFMGAWGEDNGL